MPKNNNEKKIKITINELSKICAKGTSCFL